MRSREKLIAAVCSAAGSLLLAGISHAQTVTNPDFELPSDGATGTDTVATGWTLNPAVGDDYTNPGSRCQFSTQPTPSGGSWSLWLQTFVQYGSAAQVVTGITPGQDYLASMQFEVQTGYNYVTLANQASDTNSQDTGNLYSYLEIQYENHSGTPVGTPDITDIPAGAIPTNVFFPVTAGGIAPATATQAEILIGWQNGGLDDNQGSQSAFATSVGLTSVVPEPATLSVMALGSLGLLARRRSKKA
jgi:hypothetical protein